MVQCSHSITPPIDIGEGFDVILVAGQSNTHSGDSFDPTLDTSDENIFQLGRFDDDDMQIILAEEPLQHTSKNENKIGFAMTFAKHYLQIAPRGRQVLIIPCGLGGSGFINGRWNPGDEIYEDAITRVNFVLNSQENSRLVAILWHQGEGDVINFDFQNDLDNMISSMRRDIVGDQSRTPFILGGFVPEWVALDRARQVQQTILQDTPKRNLYSSYVTTTGLTANSNEDIIHFSAEAQRILGKRYFDQFDDAQRNEVSLNGLPLWF